MCGGGGPLGFVNKAFRQITGEEAKKRTYENHLNELRRLQQQHAGEVNAFEGSKKKFQDTIASLEKLEQEKGLLEEELHTKASSGGLADKRISLESAMKSLDKKGGALEGKIRSFSEQVAGTDLQDPLSKILSDFQAQFQSKEGELQKTKKTLESIDKEENPLAFRNFQDEVKSLETKRGQTEKVLKGKHQEITSEYQKFEEALKGLTLESQALMKEREGLEGRRKDYQDTVAKEITPFETKLKGLVDTYRKQQTEAETLEKNLKSTESYLIGRERAIGNLGDVVQRKAGDWQKRAQITGIVKGLAVGAATMGAGTALGGTMVAAGASVPMVMGTLAATKGIAVLAGLSTMSSHMKDTGKHIQKGMEGLGNFQGVDGGVINSAHDLKRLFDAKVKMPEMGGIKQSLEHFKMPTLPTLGQLPKLDESMGQVRGWGEKLQSLGILSNSNQRVKRSFLNPQRFQLLSDFLRPINQRNQKRVA